MTVAAKISMNMALVVAGIAVTRHDYDPALDRVTGTEIAEDVALPRADFEKQLRLFEDFGRLVHERFQPARMPSLALDHEETKRQQDGDLKWELTCGAPTAVVSALVFKPLDKTVIIKARPVFAIGFTQWLWWFARIDAFYRQTYSYD